MSQLRLNPHMAAAPIYTPGASIEELRQRYGLEDIIKMSSNENSLGASPRAVAAIQEALANVSRYPRVSDDELRARIAETLGPGVEADNIVTSNGGTELLDQIARAFLSEGDELIISRPTFPMYEILARRQGATPIFADLDEDYSYPVEQILDRITETTQVIFVCSPNNPTGTYVSDERVEELMAGVPSSVLVVFDEAYYDFVAAPDYSGGLRYVRDGRNVLVLRSLSKSHGLAGLRVGYGVAPQPIAEYLWRARLPFHIGTLALAGALAALEDTAHVARTREVMLAERAWLQNRLTEMGLYFIPSQANFIVIRPGFDPNLVHQHLLRRGVMIRPMAFFYMPDFIRVTVGTRHENERFLEALTETLAELADMEKAGLLETEGERGKVVI